MPLSETGSIVAFGAHPDDVEFGCGGVLALAAASGARIVIVIGSRGESASFGTPDGRAEEARAAAALLGAAVEFVELGGDAHFAPSVPHQLALAAVIRRHRPQIVLAPTPAPNQHPDHVALSLMVRAACRLARYAGVAELRDQPAHSIGSLFFYAVVAEAELTETPLLFDVTPVLAPWTAAMAAHASQASSRNYLELQLTRARVHGLRAGVGHATPLWPAEPVVVGSLGAIARTARQF